MGKVYHEYLNQVPKPRLLRVAAVVAVAMLTFLVLFNPLTRSLGFLRVEKQLDGYTKVTYSRLDEVESPDTIVLTSIGGRAPFGDDSGKPRKFSDYLKVVHQAVGTRKVLLALLCERESDFKAINNYFRAHKLPQIERVTLLHAPKLTKNVWDQDTSDLNPSYAGFQLEREHKRAIAKAKNFLLYLLMDTERYALFIDLDVVKFNRNDILDVFIDQHLDIAVPRIVLLSDSSFDKDLWRGERKRPLQHTLQMMDEGRWREFDFIAGMKYGDTGFGHDKVGSDPALSIELDSVGSVVLFVKTIILKQGAMMPLMDIVGTTWDRDEGYDGMGSAGLCYLAQQMGYHCHGLPNLIAVHP